MLTDEHKQKHTGAALSFLEWYHREGDEFLDHETWVLHYTPESKRQSQEWHHAHFSAKKNMKFKQTHSIAKIMARVIFLGGGDRIGFLLLEFLPCGQTINADAYCATLKRLWHNIQNSQWDLFTSEMCLFMMTHNHTLQKKRQSYWRYFVGKTFIIPPTVLTWRLLTSIFSEK
jgi:hypothetical protein